jgi:MoaA/NifB/PqqE/SkfB family radical SAM enzyme
MVAHGLWSADHPVLAHMIPIRRCNLTCAYCNEYDRHSPPVALADLLRRVDKLAELKTEIITMSGGEPLLHPDLDGVIRRVHDHGIIAGLITNATY